MSDGCGEKRSELLRISSQGCLWRKIPSEFSTMMEAARSEDSSGRLPRSGMYANGTLSPLPTLVPRTKGIASGLWPTPTVFHALRGNHDEPVESYLARVQDHKDGKTKGKPGPSLGVAVRMKAQQAPAWIKCPCCDAYLCTIHDMHAHDCSCPPIEEWDEDPYKPKTMWPTPTARDYKGPCWNTPARDCLDHAVKRGETKNKTYPKPPEDGGRLNPNWVEWLMGYPTGWTALDASETPLSRKSQNLSDEPSSNRTLF